MFGDKEWGRNEGYPTPVDIPLDTACALIRVPCDTAWQAVLFGLLFSLTSPEAWQQFEGGLSREDAAERWEEMFNQAREDFVLGCDAIFPAGVRWNADCNCVEVEGAGGVWTANPLADPRHGGAYLVAPLDTDDPRCDAATNMATAVKKIIDGLEDDADALLNAAEILAGIAVLVWGFGMLADLVLLVAEVLVSLGIAAIKDAFTSGVYETLKCIFYCRIDAEGQVSVEALGHITDDINSQLGGIVATVMGYVLNSLMGEVGLSNAGALGDETGDCGGCLCGWCYQYLWQSGSPDSWGVVAGQGGSFFFSSPYWVWDGTLVGSVPSSLGIEALLGDGSVNYHITDWTIEWAMADAFGTFNDFVRFYDKDGAETYNFSPGIADGGSQAQILSEFHGLDFQAARVLIRGDARNYVVAINFCLTGDEDSPFDSSNCE